jgi:hypothetical protein
MLIKFEIASLRSQLLKNGRMAIRPYKNFGQFFVLIFWAIRELTLQ